MDVHPLDLIRVDGDDLSDLIVELERSFAIELPRNLRHVETAGDLFDEILKCRRPDGAGDRCDTAMAFYLLRRELSGLGLDRTARPGTVLSKQNLPSPWRIAKSLKRDLGLQPPPLVISRAGCILASVVVIAAIGFSAWFWSVELLALWLLILPIFAVDRGGWTGDWQTLGTLSEAVAVRNVATFADAGARTSEAHWWRHFSQMLAGISFEGRREVVDHKAIGRSTRFDVT